jgi:pRiA4b ORF-3-like protein
VYQIKVTLMETDPAIWRRLRVPGNTTLPRLDRVIQTAMGWTNSHLEILRNPRHDEYMHTKTWIESMTGGPFDPDTFDVEAVNAAL